MTDALIGHTGFVGGNLARQHTFEANFNSKNIEQIAGQEFDLLVCSGMPAAKWIANGDPAGDLAVMNRLMSNLSKAAARQAVIISTVDVYPRPIDVDEDSPIDEPAQQPYGRHRLMLERQVSEHFARTLVVRLPGLFGCGLKKNAIYDLLHDNDVHKINAAGVFQFYDLSRLWHDIQVALDAGLRVVNFATEPISVADVAREAFGISFNNDPGGVPARYDMRSKHAELFGGQRGYLYDRQQVIAGLHAFLAEERARGA